MNNAKWTAFAIIYQCCFAKIIGVIAAVLVLAFMCYMLFVKKYHEASKLKGNVKVSSATTNKWKGNATGKMSDDGKWQSGGLAAVTYNVETENGGGKILGVTYPVEIRGELSITAAILTFSHIITYGMTYITNLINGRTGSDFFITSIVCLAMVLIMTPLTVMSFKKIRKK